MNEGHDIELLIRSHTPIIVIESPEETRVIDMLIDVGRRLFHPVHHWAISSGLQRIDHDNQQSRHMEPAALLQTIKSHKQASPSIYIISDFHPYLDQPLPIRLLKDIALERSQLGHTVVLLSHELELPSELKHFATYLPITLPDDKTIALIIREVVMESIKRNKKNHPQINADIMKQMVHNLKGISHDDVKRLARNAILDDGAITESDLPQVMQAKHELLNKEGILSFEFDTSQFSEVGGLKK